SETDRRLRHGGCKVCLKELVLTFESCATETYEPCQVRKEEAVSSHFRVPRGSSDRAMNLSNAWDCPDNDGVRLIYLILKHVHSLRTGHAFVICIIQSHPLHHSSDERALARCSLRCFLICLKKSLNKPLHSASSTPVMTSA